MKTTVELDPKLYAAAQRLAKSQNKSVGQLLSELLRKSLGLNGGDEALTVSRLEKSNGFDVFPERKGKKATIESVRRLVAEELP
jgi:hypothetical protein